MIRVLLVFLLFLSETVATATVEPASGKCAHIFYDAAPRFTMGRIHALFLENLLGHFPHIQLYLSPISTYKEGELNKCDANFYLGTHYDSKIPPAFLRDYVTTEKNVLWAGYGIWKLSAAELSDLWGVRYKRLSTLDQERRDSHGDPGFYKYYDYKGETFIKYGAYSRAQQKFLSAFEIVLTDLLSEDAKANVVSWARHSTTGERHPYILRNRNHWFIAESPFAFMTEEDRFLIFTDILFDVLNEKPRHAKKPAVFRIEDIHPRTQLWQLFDLIDTLHELQVPAHFAMIPMFVDPHGASEPTLEGKLIPITKEPAFLEALAYAKKRNNEFILHGVTHQYKNMLNPHSGSTGDDFEFWNIVENKPIPEDSPRWVVNRIEEGWTLLSKVGIKALAWETPHYQASPLDYIMFGQMFRWNMGRVIYFPYVKHEQSRELPDELTFDVANVAGNGKRLPYFKDLKVTYPDYAMPSGQFFPFEIYGDIYGQRVLPENVGNVQPYESAHVPVAKTFEDLKRVVKRNRVLRDVWASVFFHPFLLREPIEGGIAGFPGDVKQLIEYIKLVRASGYEFVNLREWTQKNTLKKRPKTIERYVP